MSDDHIGQVQARLAAWRERGEDRLDPVRFYAIEALARRAALQHGATRRLLDDRLAKLLLAYQGRIEASACTLAARGVAGTVDIADGTIDASTPDASVKMGQSIQSDGPTPGRLAALLVYIASQSPDQGSSAGPGDISQAGAHPELAAIDYFRNTWARVGANRQLRQSRAQVPDNAGPLNSSNLAHRSLALMQNLSPGYLHHFLSYIDALSWMEPLIEGGPRVGKDNARAAKVKAGRRSRV